MSSGFKSASAAGEPEAAPEGREPQLFRFGLKQLFLVVSAASLLFALLTTTPGPWPWLIAVFAALFMAPMTWGLAQVIGSGAVWHTFLQVVIAGAGGGAVYVAVLWSLGSDDLALLGQLRGRAGAPTPAEATVDEQLGVGV